LKELKIVIDDWLMMIDVIDDFRLMMKKEKKKR
jgi:hypothetical protein